MVSVFSKSSAISSKLAKKHNLHKISFLYRKLLHCFLAESRAVGGFMIMQFMTYTFFNPVRVIEPAVYL